VAGRLRLEIKGDTPSFRAFVPDLVSSRPTSRLTPRSSPTASASVPFGARLALLTLRGLARLPLRWLHRIGGVGGRIVYRLSSAMRTHLRDNVRRSGILGPVDDEALERFALINATELGKGVLEVLPAWFGRPADILQSVRLDSGWAQIEPLLASGHGVILLTPHLGAFEVTAQFIASRIPLTIMYRPPRLRWLRPVLRHGRSQGLAQLTTADTRGVRALLRVLRRGEAIGLLPDQVPAKHHGVVVADFFGHPVHTTTLIGRLQQATGAAVVFVRMRRLPDAQGFELSVVPIETLPADDGAAALILNQVQEDLIRSCPEQYLWSYNRFKAPMTPPTDE
jgi:KDO2-lipid IV(A) lauroyltransferase